MTRVCSESSYASVSAERPRISKFVGKVGRQSFGDLRHVQGEDTILQAARGEPFLPDGFAPEALPLKKGFRHDVPV